MTTTSVDESERNKSMVNVFLELRSLDPNSMLENVWTFLALFRLIDPMAKLLVTQFFLIQRPVSFDDVLSWLAGEEKLERVLSHLTQLQSFGLLSVLPRDGKAPDADGELKIERLRKDSLLNDVVFTLVPIVSRQLRRMLLGLDKVEGPLRPLSDGVQLRSKEFLEDFAFRQWDGILSYILNVVNERGEETKPSKQVREILYNTYLITRKHVAKKAPKHSKSRIPRTRGASVIDDSIRASYQHVLTDRGYKFLFMERRAQLWTILTNYLSTSEQRGHSQLEVVFFLFQLSFVPVGMCYDMERLTNTQKEILVDISGLGIVYIDEEHPGRFYSTPFILDLSTDTRPQPMKDGDRCLIMEPNFRLYCMSGSNLYLAIISLFTHIHYSMIVTSITRESILSFLKLGVHPESLVRFIERHTHHQVRERNRKNFLVDSVVNQVRIWSHERLRISAELGVLLESFPSESIFNATMEYAKENDSYIWHSDDMLFVNREGVVGVKKYFKNLQQKNIKQEP